MRGSPRGLRMVYCITLMKSRSSLQGISGPASPMQDKKCPILTLIKTKWGYHWVLQICFQSIYCAIEKWRSIEQCMGATTRSQFQVLTECIVRLHCTKILMSTSVPYRTKPAPDVIVHLASFFDVQLPRQYLYVCTWYEVSIYLNVVS